MHLVSVNNERKKERTMAESSYSCDVSQGFNFQRDAQDTIGFIKVLKIGDTELKADFTLTNPEDVAATIKAVGVLSNIYWEGGYADPIQFSGMVSVDNKNAATLLTHKSLSNTEVELEFVVYKYDEKAKKYFRAFHCNDVKLTCLVQKSGRELNLSIDNDQSMEVMSPKNFQLTMGAMPQDVAMEIHLAVSKSDKFVEQFGVEVKA